jgi:hypothetical protein
MVYSQIWLNLPRDDHHFSHTYGWLPLWLQTKIPWKNTGDELPKHTGLYWGQYLLLTQGLKFEVPTNMFCFRFWVLFSRYLQPSNHFNYHYRNPVYILHIVKDVMVVKLFPSIHPVIRPWMASYREENPGRNKYPPPCAHLWLSRKACPAPVSGLLPWSAVCCYLTGHKQCKHQDFQPPRSWWIHAECAM